MEPLIMVNEAAKILSRSPAAVRFYVAEGKLRALRTNRGVRLFRRRDVEKFARRLLGKEKTIESD